MRLSPLSLLLPFVSACASAGAPARPVPQTATPPAMEAAPTSIRWTRSSAEHRALLLQVYRSAGAQLERRAAGIPAGSWAVILDADETVLDNALYQQERATLGKGYSADSWDAWVRRRAAPALPGAVAFTLRAHALGGLVAIVTNRAESVCPETRDNLQRVGIIADIVLCQAAGQSGDKNSRFEEVEDGRTPAKLPPLRVLMWVGDNIQDFPKLGQELRAAADDAFAQFGQTYFMLPNPMYGSWERNPLP